MLKGAIHCHSKYSDGEFTLAELRQLFVQAGCQFVCMTDHAEYFDQQSLSAYINECETLSDDQFRFIAGLEYECQGRMHVLGYGVTSLVQTTDPEGVIRHIQEHDGVSVIAHPMDRMFPWIESFSNLPDGIETWNTKYDGTKAPRPGTFRLLNRLQQRKPEMRAFYGQDLHWRRQSIDLTNLVRSDWLSRAAVLKALEGGKYSGWKDDLELPSTGVLPPPLLERFDKLNTRYQRKQRLFRHVKKMSGAFGRKLPASAKAHLRRIFS